MPYVLTVLERQSGVFWNVASQKHVMSVTFWKTIGFNPWRAFYCKLQVWKQHICAINILNFCFMQNLLVIISSMHEHKYVEVFGNIKSDLYIWQEISGYCHGMISLSTKVALFWFLAGQISLQGMLNDQWGCETSLWLRTICTTHN